MPWLNWPNRITIARILLVVPLVICLLNLKEWEYARWATIVLFVCISLTDAIDGYLARRLKEETALGKYLDPLADKLLVTCSVIILALEGTAVPEAELPNWVPVMVIGKDLFLLIGFGLIFATTGQYFIRPRPLGKACTMIQLLMIGMVLIAPDLPRSLDFLAPTFWWLATVCAVAAAVDYMIIGNRFARDWLSRADSARGPLPR